MKGISFFMEERSASLKDEGRRESAFLDEKGKPMSWRKGINSLDSKDGFQG